MYYRCCVPGCNSLRQDIQLHKFPVNKERLQLWLKYIKSKILESINLEDIVNRYQVCHKHFESRFITSKLNLRITAVPTLFSDVEISSGVPNNAESTLDILEHSFANRKHFDHTYAKIKVVSLTHGNEFADLEPSTSKFDVIQDKLPILALPEPIPSNLKIISSEDLPKPLLIASPSELNKPSPPPIHEGIFCDNCKQEIIGFRYKCVTCEDYDLCMRCEMQEVHPNHFMLRFSRPIKIKIADNLIEQWRLFFKAEHITVSQCDLLGNHSDSDTNDEDSITKGTNAADSLLPNDIKDKIREEVSRVIKGNKVEKIIKPRIRNKSRKDKEMLSSYSVAEPVSLSLEKSTPYTNKIIAKRKNVDTANSTQNLYEIEKINTNPMIYILDRRKKPKLNIVSKKQSKPLDSSKQQLHSSKQQLHSSKQQLHPSKQQLHSSKQQPQFKHQTTPSKYRTLEQPHLIDEEMEQSPTNT